MQVVGRTRTNERFLVTAMRVEGYRVLDELDQSPLRFAEPTDTVRAALLQLRLLSPAATSSSSGPRLVLARRSGSAGCTTLGRAGRVGLGCEAMLVGAVLLCLACPACGRPHHRDGDGAAAGRSRQGLPALPLSTPPRPGSAGVATANAVAPILSYRKRTWVLLACACYTGLQVSAGETSIKSWVWRKVQSGSSGASIEVPA